VFKRVAWGLLGLGVLSLMAAAGLALHNRQSMSGMELVPATVARRVDVLTNGIRRTRPVVAFTTLSGQAVEFVALSTLKDEEDLHVIYRVTD